MKLDDPFPLERFPQGLQESILLQFGKRCPTIQEVARVSDRQWLKLPAIGPLTLGELRRVIQDLTRPAKGPALAEAPDADLLAQRDRLRREVEHLREELGIRRHQVRAITAELRRRGIPSQCPAEASGKRPRRNDATERAKTLAPVIAEIQASGASSFEKIAAGLEARGIVTANGRQWTATQVKRTLKRVPTSR